jgi:hypothetical protein
VSARIRRGKARLAPAAALLALLLLTGCGAIQRARSGLPGPLGQPSGCTLIGCVGAFVVEFSGANPPDRFDVTLAETGGETVSFTCENGTLGGYESSLYGVDMTTPGSRGLSMCRDNGFQVTDFWPAEVTIDVQWGDPDQPTQGVLITMNPSYQISQPNGPGCPPTCRNTLITFPLE